MDKIKQIEQELITIAPEQMQSISALMEMGARLSTFIAYTGSETAKAKKALLIAKKQAYFKAMEDLKNKGKEVAPSLVKDFVSTMCAEQEEHYLLCDRMNAAATHTLDFIRSCISALKTEMATINSYNS